MLKNGRVREECAQTRYGPKRMPSLPVEPIIGFKARQKDSVFFFFFFNVAVSR